MILRQDSVLDATGKHLEKPPEHGWILLLRRVQTACNVFSLKEGCEEQTTGYRNQMQQCCRLLWASVLFKQNEVKWKTVYVPSHNVTSLWKL